MRIGKADGKDKSRVMQEPEGPDQVAEKVRRTREGFSGRIMRFLWRVTGLENLSPAKKIAVLAIGAAGLALLGLGLFTELSYSWLFTTVLLALPLIFQKETDEYEEDKKDEYSGTDYDADSDTDPVIDSDTSTYRGA